jgi:hypothetical protein
MRFEVTPTTTKVHLVRHASVGVVAATIDVRGGAVGFWYCCYWFSGNSSISLRSRRASRRAACPAARPRRSGTASRRRPARVIHPPRRASHAHDKCSHTSGRATNTHARTPRINNARCCGKRPHARTHVKVLLRLRRHHVVLGAHLRTRETTHAGRAQRHTHGECCAFHRWPLCSAPRTRSCTPERPTRW